MAKSSLTKLGHRSGLEDEIALSLQASNVPYTYEAHSLSYYPTVKTYLPDFILGNGIIVEGKGQFVSADRAKHLLIKKQHPALDIRFVFSRAKTFLVGQKNKEFVKWLKKKVGIIVPFNRIPPEINDRYREDFFKTLPRKPSQTTYADWCIKHGYKFAEKRVPIEWTKEEPNPETLEAMERILNWKGNT